MNAAVTLIAHEALSPEIADAVLAEALGDPASPDKSFADALLELEVAWPLWRSARAARIAADQPEALDPTTAEQAAENKTNDKACDAWCAALATPAADHAELLQKIMVFGLQEWGEDCDGWMVDHDLIAEALGKDALRLVRAVDPSPGALSAKIAAYYEAEAAANDANDALDAAETAWHDIYHGPRPRVPAEPILTVQIGEKRLSVNDWSEVCPAREYTCFTEEEVRLFGLPEGRVEQMLAALKERDALVAQADVESGLAAAAAARDAARTAGSDAWGRAQDTALEVLDHVPASMDEVRAILAFAQHAFTECYVSDGDQIEAYRRLASRTGGLSSDARRVWKARWSETYEAACREAAKDQEASDAYERVRARMPAMPPKGWLYDKGEPKRELRLSELTDADTGRFLNFIPKAAAEEIRSTVADYWAEHDRLEAEEGSERLTDEADALAEETGRLRRRLYGTLAPGVEEVADKIEEFCRNDMHTCIRFDDAEDVERALAMGGEAAFFVHLYRDLAALCGRPDPTADVVGFDAAAWVERVEALPGHHVTDWGVVAYDDEAFPDMPSREDMLITDPEAIAAYEAYIRALWTTAGKQPPERERGGHPFVIAQSEAILWAYPDNPERQAHYRAVWDRYIAVKTRKAAAPGEQLWSGLSLWQRQLVKDFAKQRSRNRREDADGVITLSPEAEAKIAAMSGKGGAA